MKLNDAKKGVGAQLDAETRAELAKFLDGPRNRLAHRFLIQAMPAIGDGGVVAMAPHVVWKRGMELVEDLPDTEPPPESVLDRLAKLSEAAALGDMGPESFR